MPPGERHSRKVKELRSLGFLTTLSDVAAMVPGVGHVEIDAEDHLGLVRDLDVVSTPTVLVLDADGRIVSRASGQPRKAM